MLGRVLKRLWTLSLVNIVSALSSLTLFIASMMNAEGNFELWQIEEASIMWIVFYAFKSKILCYLRRHGVLTQRSYYLVLTLRCVKSVRICRFSGSHFPAFALIRRIRTLTEITDTCYARRIAIHFNDFVDFQVQISIHNTLQCLKLW